MANKIFKVFRTGLLGGALVMALIAPLPAWGQQGLYIYGGGDTGNGDGGATSTTLPEAAARAESRRPEVPWGRVAWEVEHPHQVRLLSAAALEATERDTALQPGMANPPPPMTAATGDRSIISTPVVPILT